MWLKRFPGPACWTLWRKRRVWECKPKKGSQGVKCNKKIHSTPKTVPHYQGWISQIFPYVTFFFTFLLLILTFEFFLSFFMTFWVFFLLFDFYFDFLKDWTWLFLTDSPLAPLHKEFENECNNNHRYLIYYNYYTTYNLECL